MSSLPNLPEQVTVDSKLALDVIFESPDPWADMSVFVYPLAEAFDTLLVVVILRIAEKG